MRPRLNDQNHRIFLTTILLQAGLHEFDGAILINTDMADNKPKSKRKDIIEDKLEAV